MCVDISYWGEWILRILPDPPHTGSRRYPSGSSFSSRPYHPSVLRGAGQIQRRATTSGTGQTDRWIGLERHGASKRVDSEGNSLLRLMMAFFRRPPLSRTALYAASRCGGKTAKATSGPGGYPEGTRLVGEGESSDAPPFVCSSYPLLCRKFSIYKKVSPPIAYHRWGMDKVT